MKKLFLASTSPRRQSLLKDAGYNYSVISPDTDEIESKGESPVKMVERFAMEKALAGVVKVKKISTSGVLISADTTVVSPDKKKILNKPVSAEHAKKMLASLSGKKHAVLTGYVICEFMDGEIIQWHSAVVRTMVEMKKISKKDIHDYVASGEPLDKAGSYAAQGIGMCLIEKINGSYSNVVGLPMAELVNDLEKRFGLYPSWKKR